VTFEELLVKYIYQNKKVSLEGFGTVLLTAAVPDTETINKNRHIPIEGLQFEHNLRAQTDDSFVAFYAQQKGKIKPLALSDIESHLQLARQLINIGNPYVVDGLGSFEKQNNGSVLLIPGYYYSPQSSHAPLPGKLKERVDVSDKRREIEEENEGGGLSPAVKKVLIGIVTVLLIAIAGWFIWSKFAESTTNTEPTAVTPSIDSNDLVKIDSPSINADSTNITTPVTAENSLPKWKAYFRQITEKEDALRKFKMYAGNKTVMMETDDSVTFRLFVIIDSPISDTARKVDSLRRFFARNVRLEPLK
jgi:uncharacterized protein YxeA